MDWHDIPLDDGVQGLGERSPERPMPPKRNRTSNKENRAAEGSWKNDESQFDLVRGPEQHWRRITQHIRCTIRLSQQLAPCNHGDCDRCSACTRHFASTITRKRRFRSRVHANQAIMRRFALASSPPSTKISHRTVSTPGKRTSSSWGWKMFKPGTSG